MDRRSAWRSALEKGKYDARCAELYWRGKMNDKTQVPCTSQRCVLRPLTEIIKLQEASTQKSANTHAGGNLAWLTYAARGKRTRGNDAGKTPLSLALLVWRGITPKKTERGL